jgi:hypothetical protein
METDPDGKSEESADMPNTWAGNVGCIGVTLITAALLAFLAWLCAGHPGVQ